MLQKVQDLQTQDLSKGLNTNPNIFSVQKNQTPNCMNVNINYDGSIEKRLGSNTQNSVSIAGYSASGFNPNSGNTLQNQLISYWQLDEASGTRYDSLGSNNLSQSGNPLYSSGIKNQAVLLNAASSQYLYCAHNTVLNGSGGFTINTWVYLASTSLTSQRAVVSKDALSGSGGIDSNAVLVLHCNGSDGSTNFTDSSLYGKLVTAMSGAVVDGVNYKFATGSYKGDGGGSYLSIPDSDDFYLGSSNFTIDFWTKFDSFPASTNYFSFMSQWNTGQQNFLYLLYNASGTYQLQLYYTIDGTNNLGPVSSTISVTTGSWYHVALVRSGSSVYQFLNGTTAGSLYDIGTANLFNSNRDLVVGALSGATIVYSLSGNLDEIRLSKGIARWTDNFTPPTSEYATGTVSGLEYQLFIDTDNKATFRTSNVGTSWTHEVKANSLGTLSTSTWYNLIAYYNTAGHIGIKGNLSLNTAACAGGIKNGSGGFYLGADASSNYFDGRIDETGFWSRVLTDQNQSDLYNSGNANTYGVSVNAYPWACFDFGASSIRWLTVCAGTGIYSSSNLGVSFVNIATSRTATYQYLERSKNILVATSENYDTPLAWTGSAGTYCTVMNPSAPLCKYSINFNGFLIFLNSNTSKKSFNYIDENLQMTGSGWLNFDIPSSADDEITSAFILRRYLYVSTRYALFRVSYVGGNPDWQYILVKNWGFLPRTVKKIVMANMQPGQGMMYSIGEVAMGLTWDQKIRIFDGSGDQIVSNNIEQDNGQCDFSLSKVSYLGSGPMASFAETDTNANAYRLALVLGQDSQQTTHFVSYDGRALGFYPWDNMGFNCMCMAESANRRFLMAFDRSGRCHMMNSGNLDGNTTPINDLFDTPLLFNKTPSQSSKGHRMDLYFINNTAGSITYLDRIDCSETYKQRRNIAITGSGGKTLKFESIDIPQTYNIYQGRIMSSGATTDPWKLIRYDHFTSPLGIGKND